jgi:xylulokinase
MEGATMGLNYGFNRLRELGVDPAEVTLTGGGARNKAWRRMAADVFDAEVVTLREEEGAAYGAALQALWTHRLSLGERVSISEITDEVVEIDESSRLRPIRRNAETYRRLQATQDRLSRDLRGLFRESG